MMLRSRCARCWNLCQVQVELKDDGTFTVTGNRCANAVKYLESTLPLLANRKGGKPEDR